MITLTTVLQAKSVQFIAAWLTSSCKIKPSQPSSSFFGPRIRLPSSQFLIEDTHIRLSLLRTARTLLNLLSLTHLLFGQSRFLSTRIQSLPIFAPIFLISFRKTIIHRLAFIAFLFLAKNLEIRDLSSASRPRRFLPEGVSWDGVDTESL
ncbi:uncharacterized protein K444DRAFT_33644 [Hyaloscypha bicolor E]|uniref:Uncharacterized protein n=1 Tax=Hyaloscypha bicolor E TaxID=1095630 RepID=A0A2J6T131_9HELO|nr:uncharacterized protein K444DRAFT_33644 [Hyaloscypha bicolor E]PMD56727.1 hypothetical protein K444DRAFT_33644 [Hyaloscypha bicolor E]